METLTIENVVLSEKDYLQIKNIVYEHCGINLHTGKKELVRARLSKLLRQGHYAKFSDYIKAVMEDKTGRQFSTLIDTLSTNLTSFFREKQHFDFLSKEFIPRMIQRKQKNSNFRFRAWSAGCSSGEEPYSIAITLLEEIKGLGRWDVKVLATDISTRILETAKEGIYDSQRVGPVPAMQKSKYLMSRTVGGRRMYEVGRELRDTVIFRYLNLMKAWPITGPLDFIFCRNVMIYFDKPTQQKLVNRYWDLLDSGGLLFTGHSESLTGIDHKFKYIQPTIYAKP